MSKQALLGAAFASADLIFEVGKDGLITFALGATSGLVAMENGPLVGQSWRNLFSAADQELLAALVQSVGPGERRGPLQVCLAPYDIAKRGRGALLSVFRLPDRPNDPLSCALAIGGDAIAEADGGNGLIAGEKFTDVATRLLRQAEQAGGAIRVDLVELPGLTEAAGKLPDDKAEALRRRVAATLRASAIGGEGASELAPDRFAVLRSVTSSSRDLNDQLGLAVGGLAKPRTTELELSGSSPDQTLRALRFALDRYIEAGPDAASRGFSAVIQETAVEAARLKTSMAAHSWKLVYQPVVRLSDQKLHHFEALARFEAGVSPAESIHLAEELGIIVEFDLSVARAVADVLKTAPLATEIAINVSAISLMLPSFQKALAEITRANDRLRPRILIEVTETQKMADLPAANLAIQALRRIGHPVCLDDFGAGAASLDYLRHLEVDFVKFDGRYIKTLTAGTRDEVVLKHMVNLCRELQIATIAEMIEQTATAKLAESLGVTLGQGWCFGKPNAELKYPLEAVAVSARRSGEKVSWG